MPEEDPEIKKLNALMARVTKKVMKLPGWKDDFKMKAAKDDLKDYHDEDDVVATDEEIVSGIERDRMEDA